jgi:hypothetical protein
MPAPELDLSPIEPLVRELGCRFVTVDFALRSDGAWRVLEIGDGQVSDRPGTLAPHRLLAALAPLSDPDVPREDRTR